jgi:hypothetical protein
MSITEVDGDLWYMPAEKENPEGWAKTRKNTKRAWSAVHNNIGLVPLVAPLLAAGYYQADLAESTFQWAFPWYLLFPLSIEAGAAWAAGNYYRRLLSGHSTISARLGMIGYAAASGLLLYWHARNTGRPTVAALAVAGLTFAGVWIWTQKAKHDNRTRLEEMGLVDKQVPRFSFARWVLCPLETPAAFRWAVKFSYSDPSEALSDYRNPKHLVTIDPTDYSPPVVEIEDKPLDSPDRAHAVYQILSADGERLYIGITSLYRKGMEETEADLPEEMLANRAVRIRLAEHRRKQEWAGKIDSINVLGVYPSREVALVAEKSLISTNQPPHNVVHNPSRPRRRRTVTRRGGRRPESDAQVIEDLKRAYPDWQTRDLNPAEIRRAVGGGQSRAYRLQSLLKEQIQ